MFRNFSHSGSRLRCHNNTRINHENNVSLLYLDFSALLNFIWWSRLNDTGSERNSREVKRKKVKLSAAFCLSKLCGLCLSFVFFSVKGEGSENLLFWKESFLFCFAFFSLFYYCFWSHPKICLIIKWKVKPRLKELGVRNWMFLQLTSNSCSIFISIQLRCRSEGSKSFSLSHWTTFLLAWPRTSQSKRKMSTEEK